MKKLVYIILFLFLLSPVSIFADDFFDNYTGIDRAWDGQKAINNKEFEEAINTLTEKKQKKSRKKKLRQKRKR